MNYKIVKCIQISILSMFCILISCATSKYQKVTIADSATIETLVDPSILILLLPPDFRYESIENEKDLNLGQSEVQLEKYLQNRTLSVLGSKGFQLKSIEQISGESADYEPELSELLTNSNLLFKAYIDEKYIQTISGFSRKTSIPAIMVFNCDVKVGSAGSYDPNSGAITSKNNKAILKAVLLKTSDCSKLWSTSIQLRELPKIGDTDFEKSINSIFTNLKPKGE